MFRRLPSKRALAALAKLHGCRLEKRWPFLIRADRKDLNLTFEDVLEFQFARSRSFMFVNVGAFDGLANDPIGRFVRNHDCHGILLEPQPATYAKLVANYRDFPQFTLLNAAIDEVSGTRTLYCVRGGDTGLPEWTQQIASFLPDHVLKHDVDAPGIAACVQTQQVRTISFDDLLDEFSVCSIDVLQIDAEGMDGQLIKWFPFERLRPAVIHYESMHLSGGERSAVRSRLRGFGYRVQEADSAFDDMAVII